MPINLFYFRQKDDDKLKSKIAGALVKVAWWIDPYSRDVSEYFLNDIATKMLLNEAYKSSGGWVIPQDHERHRNYRPLYQIKILLQNTFDKVDRILNLTMGDIWSILNKPL